MVFKDIVLGYKDEFTHLITENDVQRFSELTGDNNKLHIDKEFAAKTTFKKPVAHGMLSASFISTMIGTRIPGEGALWLKQDLEFLLPVRVGDTITVQAEVIAKSERDNTIKLSTNIFNQKKQKVISGTALVKVPEEIQKPLASETPDLKSAIIIGASGEIGRAIAETLDKEGYKLALHFFSNKSELEELMLRIDKKGEKHKLYSADISDSTQVTKMINRAISDMNSATALINCATLPLDRLSFESATWEDVDKQINNQVRGAFNLIKAVLPEMKKNKYGKIIHISTLAVDQPVPGMFTYITSKSGLNGMLKSLAIELAGQGIRVNMVSPGFIDTQLNLDVSEKNKMLIAAKTPLKRLGTPQDVANAVKFLISSESDFITGETIRVNGGQIMI